MISKEYPSKGTARAAAKEYAAANNLKAYMLIVAAESRKFHFTDEEPSPENKQLVFEKYKLVKGKWRDVMKTGEYKRSVKQCKQCGRLRA